MNPMDEMLDQAREELRRRKSKRARGDALERSLAKKLGISAFTARDVLDRLRQEGVLEGQWKNMRTGFTGMVEIRISSPRSEQEIAWEAAMREAGMSDSDVGRLMLCAPCLEGVSHTDMRRLANGLLQLRENQKRLIGERRYSVSAHYLLGSSKALDALPSSALRAFGIDPDNFVSAPLHVMVAGPPSPDQVILVENPQAFEEGVRSRLSDTAWVATQGYGLSRNGDAFGNQLVRIVEDGHLIPLVRAGSPPSLEKLLSHDRLFFWGDLDPAGLDIYIRLKKQLPKLQLSGLYHIMLEKLQNHCGHPLVPLTGKDGQTACSGSGLPHDLVQSCTVQGLDQEIIDSSEIAAHAAKAW